MPSAPTLCNCLCGAPLVAFASIATMLVALAALDGVAGVNHWVATERAGIIVPKVDYPFKQPSQLIPHLIEFLGHESRLTTFRTRTTAIESRMFGLIDEPVDYRTVPDLLSHVHDYRRNVSGNELTPLPTSCVILDQKDILMDDHIGRKKKKKSAKKTKTPKCQTPAKFSMNLYLHLPSISLDTPPFEGVAEEVLGEAAWAGINSGRDTPLTHTEIGTLLTSAMSKNKTSWVLNNLAALFWRIEGDAHEATRCLLGALSTSPYEMKDVALIQLANVLYLAKAYDDAIILVKAALAISSNTYAANYLHGSILLALGDDFGAQRAFAHAIELQPELKAGFEINGAVSSIIKQKAAVLRREHEVNLRKLMTVLPLNTTWDSFDYEIPFDVCHDAACGNHSTCVALGDPVCVCDVGYMPESDGGCVPDTACNGVTCPNSHEECREGTCRCKSGFHLNSSRCMQDLCANAYCIENSHCKPGTGRCTCNDGYFQRGPECVTQNCQNVSCIEHAFCNEKTECACVLGFHLESDECVKDTPCQNSHCPPNAYCNKTDGHCRCSDGFDTLVEENVCAEEGTARTEAAETAKGTDSSSPYVNMLDEKRRSNAAVPAPPEIYRRFWAAHRCHDDMRNLPVWTAYSTAGIIPPKSMKVKEDGTMEGFWTKLKKKPKTYKTPLCTPKTATFSYATFDHIEGVSLRASDEIKRAFKPEGKLDLFLHRVMGNTTRTLKEMGHIITSTLKKKAKNVHAYNVASVWWMVEGNVEESLNCIRAALLHATPEESVTPTFNAANIMTSVGRSADAHTLAHIAYSLKPDNQLAQYTFAIAVAGAGRNEAAIKLLRKVAAHGSGIISAPELIHHIECYQLHKLLLQTPSFEPGPHLEKLALLTENVEAQRLYANLLLDRIGLSVDANEDVDDVWAEYKQADRSLELLTERAEEQVRLIESIELVYNATTPKSTFTPTVARAAAEVVVEEDAAIDENADDADSNFASDSDSASEEPDGKKVVVVQYPKAPSIPALISAVEDMLDGEISTDPMPFDDTSWPTEDDCEGGSVKSLAFPAEIPEILADEQMDTKSVINLHKPLDRPREDWEPPRCGVLQNAKKAHTLEHLEGVAKRANLTMPPQKKLDKILKGSFKHLSSSEFGDRDFRKTVTLREAGERIRLAMADGENSWFVYQMAALFWQIKGHAKESIECLQKAYYWAGTGRKDKSLIALGSVLHLSKKTLDAMTLTQMAIQVNPKKSLNHYTLGNLLVSFGERGHEEAAFFFETAYRLNAESADALKRLRTVRCLQRKFIEP